MSTSRRGFFGMLAGLAASPLIGRWSSRYACPTDGYNYTFHYRNFIADDVVSWGNTSALTTEELKKVYDHYARVFVIPHNPGMLYWFKEVT